MKIKEFKEKKDKRLEVGCGTCKHIKLEMNEIPCVNCIGYYNKCINKNEKL